MVQVPAMGDDQLVLKVSSKHVRILPDLNDGTFRQLKEVRKKHCTFSPPLIMSSMLSTQVSASYLEVTVKGLLPEGEALMPRGGVHFC